jgi:hypothetical protein
VGWGTGGWGSQPADLRQCANWYGVPLSVSNRAPLAEAETRRCVQIFWFRGGSCRRTATSWRLPVCACVKRAQHGRSLPPTNCADWPRSTRSARHPSERARRCPRMPGRRRTTATAAPRSSSRAGGYGCHNRFTGRCLPTGVSTRSDFAPERLSLRNDGGRSHPFCGAEITTELDVVAAKSRRTGHTERRFKSFMWRTRRTWRCTTFTIRDFRRRRWRRKRSFACYVRYWRDQVSARKNLL